MSIMIQLWWTLIESIFDFTLVTHYSIVIHPWIPKLFIHPWNIICEFLMDEYYMNFHSKRFVKEISKMNDKFSWKMKFNWWNKIQIHEMSLNFLCHLWNIIHSQFDIIHPNSINGNFWNMICEFVLHQWLDFNPKTQDDI
jgi:hypothetical protein